MKMSSKKKTPETLVSHSLKDLKKIIKRKRSRMPAPVATVKKDVPKSDEQIFSDAMEQVQEIKEFRNIPIHHKKRKIAAEHKSGMKNGEEKMVLEDVVMGKRRMNLPDTQEYVEWTNPGYRDDMISELHGGRYSVQDSLDIHGYTFEEAELEVERFIRASLMRGKNYSWQGTTLSVWACTEKSCGTMAFETVQEACYSICFSKTV
jgi:DNA-nicking Smr family endonuclease